jgi:hypothetical protein
MELGSLGSPLTVIPDCLPLARIYEMRNVNYHQYTPHIVSLLLFVEVSDIRMVYRDVLNRP